MDDPHIQTEATPGRAAGRLSLKVMVVSLLLIFLALTGSVGYLLVAPIIEQERFLAEVEKKGGKVGRHLSMQGLTDSWIRQALKYQEPVESYSGPLAWTADRNRVAEGAFKRVESLRLTAGRSQQSRPDLQWISSAASLGSLYLELEVEDESLMGLVGLNKLTSLTLNARRLNGGFLAYLPKAGIVQMEISNASTTPAWADLIRNHLNVKSIELKRSQVDSASLAAILRVPTLRMLQLEAATLDWPESLDVSQSRIEVVHLFQFKHDASLLSRLSRLPVASTFVIWEADLASGAFRSLEQAANLTTLIIEFGSIRGDALRSLSVNRSIKRIELNNVKADSESITHLSEVQSLEELDFYNIELNDKSVESMLKLQNLKIVSIRRCDLDDARLATVLRYESLRELIIIDTKVTAKGLEVLRSPCRLKTLKLSGHLLTPSLKAGIKKANPQLILDIIGELAEEAAETPRENPEPPPACP